MSSTSSRFARSTRLAACLLAVVTVAACTDTSAPLSPDGDYALSQINGKGLPYRMYSDTNFTLDVTRSALSLKTDGTFYVTLTSEERVEGFLSTYVDSVGGVWRQDGEAITLTMSDSTRQSGTWAGTTLTIVDATTVPSTTYLYSR
ncbi:MAG TPA: hypothetical protein VFS59_10400 [Gemmatimonadaceae bacterium]|nr:hypothetical protein [Gemmatimonadaceae bacterium]